MHASLPWETGQQAVPGSLEDPVQAPVRPHYRRVQVGPRGENIETITIDSLDLDGCDFIKIDVEGFEPLVLLGAEETIRKYKPVILFEKNFKKVSDEVLAEFGVTPEQNNSFDLLNKFGYSNIQLIGDEINYLAVPDNA